MRRFRYGLIVFLLFLTSCAVSSTVPDGVLPHQLKTERAALHDIVGNFTLILYGGRYADDIETVALLDREGDGYRFEPYAPDFDYKEQTGIPAAEAIERARRFVSFHHSFHRILLSRIVDRRGETIGFEFRPLYLPTAFGIGDVMEVNYWPEEEGKIKVRIELDPSLKWRGFQNGDGSLFDGF